MIYSRNGLESIKLRIKMSHLFYAEPIPENANKMYLGLFRGVKYVDV